jgi:hypothetical protein
MITVSLNNAFFVLRIDDVFSTLKNVYVVGKVLRGQIHDKSDVLITDDAGSILRETKIIDLDWFDRRRCGEHVTADKGMNIAVVFDMKDTEYLQTGNYIVIK